MGMGMVIGRAGGSAAAIAAALALAATCWTQAAATEVCDLGVDASLDKQSYEAGDGMTVDYRVSNDGPDVLDDVRIAVVLPEGVSAVSEEDLSRSVGSLAPGESASGRVACKVGGADYAAVFGALASTGDGGAAMACLVLLLVASAAILAYRRRRSGKGGLGSMAALAVVVGSAALLSHGVVDAYGADDPSASATCPTKIMGKPEVISVDVVSSRPQGDGTLSIDRSSLVAVEGSDALHFAGDPVLGGTLDVDASDISSFELIVRDSKGNEVDRRDIVPTVSWSIDRFGLLRDDNVLVARCVLRSGRVLEDSVTIAYPNADRADLLQIDRADSDGDGLINYLEAWYGTDPESPDTDGDGLGDYLEIAGLSYDPLSVDTDGDGTADGDEDYDGDGLTNLQEVGLGTEPTAYDTDMDGLCDGKELEAGSDPLNPDTDGDGAEDGWEVEHGFDPLSYDDSFAASDSISAAGLAATLSVDVEGSKVEQVFASPVTGTAIDLEKTPGYIGGFDFYAPEDRGDAVIRFEIEESMLDDGSVTPCVYWYDEDSQMLVEQESETNGNIVTFRPSHFSIYLVIDKTSFETVWNHDIKDPDKDEVDIPYDFSFVLDYSKSMEWNDPEWMRKTALSTFVEKFRDEDRASIVGYIGKASTLCGFTSDKQELLEAIGGIENDDGGGWDSGTNGPAGLQAALELFETEGREASNKALFFLTDGDDNRSAQYTYKQIGEIAAKRGIAIYSFVLGSDCGEAKFKELESMSAATGGKCYRGAQDDLAGYTGIMFDETVDYATDSNADGISDYYTKLICDGVLTCANGEGYSGVDFSQNADYDGDGILNGEELKVCVYYSADGSRYVYLKKISDPCSAANNAPGGVTSRDLAIFAALCYEDPSPYVGRFYDEIKGEDGKENDRGQRYYFLDGADVYQGGTDEEISKDWVIVDYAHQQVSDFGFGAEAGKSYFEATTYKCGNSVVLAYRGTSENAEWINDAFGYLAGVTGEEPFARAYAHRIASRYAAAGCDVYITGHSLGGYLAQIGLSELLSEGYEGNIAACEYFNGIGLDYAAWSILSPAGSKYIHTLDRDKLSAFRDSGGNLGLHRIYGDPVSLLGIHSGSTYVYEANQACIQNHMKISEGAADLAPVALLDAITKSFEPSQAAAQYGFGLLNLVSYTWTVHETDSFVYEIS